MENLIDYALQTKYDKVKKLRNNLELFDKIINWKKFLKYFTTKNSFVGRPEYEKVLMIKILFLQGCYGTSDEETEYQIHDRLSFQQFLGFPKTIPDYSTIWRFREELTTGNVIEDIWDELQRQIENNGIKIENGVIQDAKFIHADPGKTNSGMNDRGRNAKTSRSKDGTWTKKGEKNIFGFKQHTKTDIKTKIITEIAVTTAKVHDGNIDLAKPDEIVFRDKGYNGCKTKARGDGTMKKAARGKSLSEEEIQRNKRISKIRCRGEHPYALMTRTLKAGYTKLTTIPRVYVQQIFIALAYNAHRIKFLLTGPIA